jgi:oligoribonuclease NrnB/cAMP/cGMP phosphodiesterase (DHH superfamily)
VIPQADIPAFQAYKLDCDESSAKLTACSLNAASAAVIQQGTADQLAAVTKDRDTWEATAKGGTFWQRFKHDAIVITVTAGAAYAAGRLTK